MKGPAASLMIVTGYVIVGSLLMLASGKVGGLLKRLGDKPASYVRIAILTFGSCVAALGEFGTALHLLPLLR